MSPFETKNWLESFRTESTINVNPTKLAKVISISSGKGGVGKTSISVKLGKDLSEMGYRILLIDCDYNLSNTMIKLGLPLNDNFYDLLTSVKSFDDCIYKDGSFHLLSSCSGNNQLNAVKKDLDQFIVDIITEHQESYDYVILDCAAGVDKTTLNLNAFSDYRFVIVTPDSSSITDSYSLMKMLSNEYGVKDFHLFLNKISTIGQYKKIVQVMGETVESFLGARLMVLGALNREQIEGDLFDQVLLSGKKTKININFSKVLEKFSEEGISGTAAPPILNNDGQDVPTKLC